MNSVPQAILERSRLLPEGSILAPKEFLHLGSRAAVDQAFSRLAKSGLLLRITRGLYAAAKKVSTAERLLNALSEKTQEVVVPDGAASAVRLGLSTGQIGDLYLTSGRSRTLKWGREKVELRHAPRWMLSLGRSIAGDVVRALAWIGESGVAEAMPKLRQRLSPIDWQALSSVRILLPSWMAQLVGREAVRGSCSSAEF
ncbi:DUF6088 family protein [Pseudomonas aeruginosa]|nr:hypothetical protein [Pseudomonas aeruginosa]